MTTPAKAKGAVVRDLDGYRAYRDGDDDYQTKVDIMRDWINALPFGTKIIYDGVEYHKPEYRFQYWYEKGYTIGCPPEHTVFPEWFARAAGGEQDKVRVKK
jgi:hypothetical protein